MPRNTSGGLAQRLIDGDSRCNGFCARVNPLQRSPEHQCSSGGQEAGGEWAWVRWLCGVGVKRSPLGLHHRSYCASLYPLESMPKSTAARRRLLLEFSYTVPPCLQLPRSGFHPSSGDDAAESHVLAPRVPCAHLLLFSPPSRSAVQASSTVSFAEPLYATTPPMHLLACFAREPGFLRVTAGLQQHQQGSQN